MSKRTANNEELTADEEVKVYEVPYTIKLEYPVEWGDEQREEFTIKRRIRAGDYKGMRATELRYDDIMRLISKVSGESMRFVELLDAADFQVASEVVQSFLEPGRKTGGD